MLTLTASLKVYLSLEPCDMRKSFNGLCALVSEHLQEDPLNGALYVFCNRSRNRLKILYWDSTGLWVWAKRLEQGTFSWPRRSELSGNKLSLSPDALHLLLNGIDLNKSSRRQWYRREVA